MPIFWNENKIAKSQQATEVIAFFSYTLKVSDSLLFCIAKTILKIVLKKMEVDLCRRKL